MRKRLTIDVFLQLAVPKKNTRTARRFFSNFARKGMFVVG